MPCFHKRIDLRTCALACLLCLAVLCVARITPQTQLGRKEESFEADFYLATSNCKLPYDVKTHTLYIPIPFAKSGQIFKTNAISLNGIGNVQAAAPLTVRFDEAQPVVVNDGERWFAAFIQFTPLPVIQIDTDDGEEVQGGVVDLLDHDVLTPSRVRVFDPAYEENGGVYSLDYPANVHLRGAMTRYFPKRNYKVNFYSERGGKMRSQNISILGMRSVEGWALDSMSLDDALCRDHLGNQIWDAMELQKTEATPMHSLTGVYAELLVNGRYEGLYYVVAPIQEETVGFSREDVNAVLFYDSGSTMVDVEAVLAQENKPNIMEAMRIRYPRGRMQYDDIWTYVAPAVARMADKLYHADGNTDDLSDLFYLPSAMDMWLFAQMIDGSDNTYLKNQFYYKRDVTDDSVGWKILPWDTDQAFGLFWCPHDAQETEHYPAVMSPTSCADYTQYRDVLACPKWAYLADGSHPEWTEQLKARWKTLRASSLHDAALRNWVQNIYDLLDESGAARRNGARWGINTTLEQVQEIGAWLLKRSAFLDAYIGSL